MFQKHFHPGSGTQVTKLAQAHFYCPLPLPLCDVQYACNETVVNYLEAALNQILIYRDCFEINLQAEVKRGAEGTVFMAKHISTGNSMVRVLGGGG